MMYAMVAAVASAIAVQAFVVRMFLRELRVAHAAALQANGLPDAARRMSHSEEDARARAQLKMQKEIVQSGGLMPDPSKIKPNGI